MDSTQRTRPRTGGSPIALVVFIILSVVFAGLGYWGLAKFQAADAQVKDLTAKLDTAKINADNMSAVNKKFQTVSGTPTPETLEPTIKNMFDATTAEGIGADQQQTAKDGMTAAMSTIGQLKQTQDGLRAEIATLQAHVKSLTDQQATMTADYEAAYAAKDAEIAELNKKYESETQRLKARIDEEVVSREALQNTYYTERDAWQADNTKSVVHVAELREKLRQVTGEGDYTIEKADANITEIDPNNKLVTIDIGSTEGVRQQMRFIAFSKDPKGQPVRKGVIEIVRVLPTVSVGRILSQEADAAVGKGDGVYNLAGPGKKLFVFAGKPQVFSMEQWASFIRANGGDVTDSVQKGSQVADYLIIGEFDIQDPLPNQQIRDAQDFGVKILKEQQLKDLMALK